MRPKNGGTRTLNFAIRKIRAKGERVRAIRHPDAPAGDA
jgi:hypothetical protein